MSRNFKKASESQSGKSWTVSELALDRLLPGSRLLRKKFWQGTVPDLGTPATTFLGLNRRSGPATRQSCLIHQEWSTPVNAAPGCSHRGEFGKFSVPEGLKFVRQSLWSTLRSHHDVRSLFSPCQMPRLMLLLFYIMSYVPPPSATFPRPSLDPSREPATLSAPAPCPRRPTPIEERRDRSSLGCRGPCPIKV
jgi:hypothetical protein